MKIRITTVKCDTEPEEFEVPYDGMLPEFVHEVAKAKERAYRHAHFKTAIEIIPDVGENALPVGAYAKKKQIEQVALSLVEGEKTA